MKLLRRNTYEHGERHSQNPSHNGVAPGLQRPFDGRPDAPPTTTSEARPKSTRPAQLPGRGVDGALQGLTALAAVLVLCYVLCAYDSLTRSTEGVRGRRCGVYGQRTVGGEQTRPGRW